jgi:hypothetical protein
MDEHRSKYRAKEDLRRTATDLKQARIQLARLQQRTWAKAADKFRLIELIQSLESQVPRIKERMVQVPRLSQYRGYKSKLENTFKKWINAFYDELEHYARENGAKTLKILSTEKVFSSGAPKSENTIYYRAYDAIAKARLGEDAEVDGYGWWNIPLQFSESLERRLRILTESIGRTMVSILRSTLLPSIAGASGPGLYASLDKRAHQSYGPIIMRLKVDVSDRFIFLIPNHNYQHKISEDLQNKVYGKSDVSLEEQFKFHGIEAPDGIKFSGGRGHIVSPFASVGEVKAWSQVNGIIQNDVIVIFRPVVGRMMTIERPNADTINLKGRRVQVHEELINSEIGALFG